MRVRECEGMCVDVCVCECAVLFECVDVDVCACVSLRA